LTILCRFCSLQLESRGFYYDTGQGAALQAIAEFICPAQGPPDGDAEGNDRYQWPICNPGSTRRPPRRAAARAIRGNVEKRNDQEDALDAEAKAAFRSEAEKLIARCESPLETVKALMACNCEP